MRAAGKKSYSMLVGKPNAAKLANFPECVADREPGAGPHTPGPTCRHRRHTNVAHAVQGA